MCGGGRAARTAHRDRAYRGQERPVTADTALRLGKFFRTGAVFRMNIQARFDLETTEDALAQQIRKIAAYEV